jgi:hypothetical protein
MSGKNRKGVPCDQVKKNPAREKKTLEAISKMACKGCRHLA